MKCTSDLARGRSPPSTRKSASSVKSTGLSLPYDKWVLEYSLPVPPSTSALGMFFRKCQESPEGFSQVTDPINSLIIFS